MVTQEVKATPRRVIRRTQADRRRETRAKLIQAAAARLVEVGYAKTTLADIAQIANLTTGAIQHHFIDKRALGIAVVTEGYLQLIEQLGRIEPAPTLERTIDAVVDGVYAAFSSPAVLASGEIIRASGEDPHLREALLQFDQDAVHGAWRQMFATLPVSHERVLACYPLVQQTVLGQIYIDSRALVSLPVDFSLLKTALLHLMTLDDLPVTPHLR